MDTRNPESNERPAEALSALFGAYLNQDWAAEYDTAWDAVTDFCSGYPAVAVDRAAEQVHQILGGTTDEAGLKSIVDGLGLEYYPPGDGSTYLAWLTELEKVLRSHRS